MPSRTALRAIALTASLLMLFTSPASTTSAPKRATREARAAVAAALATRPASGTIAGVAVLDDGRLVTGRNFHRPMVPASLLKLATTSAAIWRLGPETRFSTRALVAAPLSEGTLDGHLYLVGGGDPTFATRSYRARYLTRRRGMLPSQRVFPSGSPTVEQLADRIVAAGVRTIRGELVVDESLFDTVRTRPGWRRSYFDRSTGGPHVGLLTALPVNEGFKDLERHRISRNPALRAGLLLSYALKARGVRVAAVKVGRAPEASVEVASVASPPLSEIVSWINRWSVNYAAEIVLKSLGAQVAGRGTTEAGAKVVRRTLAARGVRLEGFRMVDGSGLSLLDRATPRTIAGILKVILRDRTRAGAVLRASLPVAGRPGSLYFRMRRWPLEGRLRGKTAMLLGMRGMAGWVRARDGSLVAYVAMFNRARSPLALTRTLDVLALRLSLMGR